MGTSVGAAENDVADLLAFEDGAEAVVKRATLLRFEARWGDEWAKVAAEWLGLDTDGIQKLADRAYKGWVKAGAKDPLPGESAGEGSDVDSDRRATSGAVVNPDDTTALGDA